jgi:hypothetical protein
MLTRAGFSALLLLTLAAVAGPTPARADFGPAFAVSRPDASCGFLADPQVAIDTDGDAVFTWEQRDSEGRLRVEARRRSADGVFGPIHILSGRSQIVLFHRLAIDAAGNALVAWTLRPQSGPDHPQFRALFADDTLGPIENLASVLPADNAQVAVNATGNAVFAWRRPTSANTGVIEARTRSVAGALGPIQRVSFAGQQTFQPNVAINADGEAVFAWVCLFESQGVVQARRRSAAGEFAPVRQNLDVGDFPQTAIDRDGNSIIIWPDRRSPPRVQMRTLSSTNALGPRQPISQGSGVVIGLVRIAMNAAGDSVFGFPQADQAGNIRAKARARSAAGVFGPDQTLSGLPSIFGSLVVAGIDGRGRSLFAWTHSDGTFLRIEARTRRAAGGLGQVKTLSPAGTAISPRIAMNARGDAVLSWCQTDEAGKVRVFGTTFSP